jgi:hypothetical protein
MTEFATHGNMRDREIEARRVNQYPSTGSAVATRRCVRIGFTSFRKASRRAVSCSSVMLTYGLMVRLILRQHVGNHLEE